MTGSSTWATRFTCAWVLAALALPASARADENCPGTISGTVMSPLPRPLVVQLDTSADDAANPGLARRLIAGLERGGLAVAGNNPGSATLSLAISVTPAAGGASGPAAGSYRSMGWASGSVAPTGWDIRGTKLAVSAEVTNASAASLAWLGTLECTVATSDPGALAESLGTMIGQSVSRAAGR